MNIDFADAMRAAMTLTRAQKLVEATRVIQRALSGREPVPSESQSKAAAISLVTENNVIDLTAEVIEPEMMASTELGGHSIGQSQPSRLQNGMPGRWARLSRAPPRELHVSALMG
jgi:hypothetical protein